MQAHAPMIIARMAIINAIEFLIRKLPTLLIIFCFWFSGFIMGGLWSKLRRFMSDDD